MSASATSQPSASGADRTPQARLAPMPSSALAQRTTRAPAAPSAAASAASSGRTTAITCGTAASRCRHAAVPDAFAARQDGQQLVAAEAPAAPAGEENADDAWVRHGGPIDPGAGSAAVIPAPWPAPARRDRAPAQSTAPDARNDAPIRSTAPRAGSRTSRRCASLGQQPKLAVPHGDEHARALVHAVVVGGRHVEHALAADDFALGFDRVAQRRAERLGARLRLPSARRESRAPG